MKKIRKENISKMVKHRNSKWNDSVIIRVMISGKLEIFKKK